MEKRKIYRNCFVIFTILFTSCTDVIQVDVPDGGSRLVVEASINWLKGSAGKNQTIKLSTSIPYFESNTNTAVTGATVVVTNNNDGTQCVFNDQNNGTYTTSNFIPKLNHSYTLTIQYNKNTYTATETLTSVPNITNVKQGVRTIFGESEIEVKIFFNDPPNTNNYYLGEFYVSNSSLPTLSVLEDRFTNGNENFFIYLNNEDLEKGDVIDFYLYGISETYYNFMNLLIQQSESSGNPFQTTPAQLKGNCKNRNNPNEEVLGYFRLSEVSKISYTVN